MRFLRRSLTAIFLLAATLGIFSVAGYMMFTALQERWAREAIPATARERVFAVNVITIEAIDIAPVLTSFGELRSRRVLDLRAAAGGAIVELAEGFEEGGKVEAGQLLLQVDPTDFAAGLEVARTDLLEGEADLVDAKSAVLLAHDDLASAQKQADLRNGAHSRQIDLAARGVGTEAAVEAAALSAAAAEQAVLSRRLSLANAEARVKQAANTLARREISVHDAERRLEETKVYAEFSGTLSDVSVIKGGLVTQNAQIAQIVDSEALEVSFRVSTAQYAHLLDDEGQLVGQPIAITLDVSGIDLRATGWIDRESAEVGDGQTGRLLFARLNQASGFRPGDFVTVEITEPELKNVAILPATALDASGRVLVLIDGERLEEAQVELLRRQGDDVLVRAPGLAGREVVAERSPVLGAGIKVRAIRREGEGTGEGTPEISTGPEMITLTDERRAALVAFVKANTRMPADARERLLTTLEGDEVPASMIERLESRMGG